MPARRARHLRARTRQGLRTTAVTVAAVAALTASQAPGLSGNARGGTGSPAADGERAPGTGTPYAELAPPGDGSYHTELPPLTASEVPPTSEQGERVRAESGIPGTVLRAYRAAEKSVGRTDPGCRLPWELLAAIGKVESGQARGGAVDGNGTTLSPITGPALNGQGFALVRDTDGGVFDGDKVYDRAVGPMQFLPSTWQRWGVDGNGDGLADPNNVFDAALAAGHYLCAGNRDLGRTADMDRAILSYNNSRSYLNLVRYWLDFYRRGVHSVPDGTGVVPRSPGAGSDTPATEPVDGEGGDKGGGGIVIGPDPETSEPGTPSPSSSSSPTASSSPTTDPDPSQSSSESADPDPTASSTGDPSSTSDPSDPSDPSASTSPDPSDPSDPASSSACPSSSASSSPEGEETGQSATDTVTDADTDTDTDTCS